MIDTRSERLSGFGRHFDQETPLELAGLWPRLRAQRRKAEDLLSRNAMLLARCSRLRAETKLVCEEIAQCCETLTCTFVSVKRCRTCAPARPSRALRANLKNTAAPHDLVAALRDAIELLRMEFLETDGSGRETLTKCENALRRVQSIRTFILELY